MRMVSDIGSAANIRGRLRIYWQYTKPRIWLLFTVEALAGAVLGWNDAGSFPAIRAATIVLSVALAAIGAEALTNVIDKDIDAQMERTKSRPLPTGAISQADALILGAITIAGSLMLAEALGPLTLLLIAIGLVDNIVVYSLLAKRTTPWSIVLGSVSGGVPIWAGYAAIRLPISAAGWLLGMLVLAWIPLHIWSIAYAYADDYRIAHVPMAPVAWSERRFGWTLAAASAVLFAIALVTDWLLFRGVAAAIFLANLAAATLLVAAVKFARQPSVLRAKQVFLACNIYLLLLFLGVIADVALFR